MPEHNEAVTTRNAEVQAHLDKRYEHGWVTDIEQDIRTSWPGPSPSSRFISKPRRSEPRVAPRLATEGVPPLASR